MFVKVHVTLILSRCKQTRWKTMTGYRQIASRKQIRQQALHIYWIATSQDAKRTALLRYNYKTFLQSKNFNKENLSYLENGEYPLSIKTNILNTRNKTHFISRNYSESKEKQSLQITQLFVTSTTMAQMSIFGGHFESKITKFRNECFWHPEHNSKKRSVPLHRLREPSRLVKQ